MVSYHEANVQLSEQEKTTEEAIKQQTNELDLETVDDAEGALGGCAVDHLQCAMQEVTETNARIQQCCSSEDLLECYNSLNSDQKTVVDTVLNKLGSSDEPIRLIVSGQGGTGKSRIIDILARMVSNSYSTAKLVPVVVTAPTGLSAFNVGGTTIPRLLSLPIEHGKPANYNPLIQDQLVTLRATPRGLKLLIVDEVSMVSSLTLTYIHLRLTEIMGQNKLFGGVNIVFFADLLQLPPVKGNQPFMKVTNFEMKQRLGAVGSLHLWETFSYYELTRNMRQKGDKACVDLRSCLRIGRITNTSYSLLRKRMIAQDRRATMEEIRDTYQKLVDDHQCPLILMPTTSLCSEVNSTMLQKNWKRNTQPSVIRHSRLNRSKTTFIKNSECLCKNRRRCYKDCWT
jgi:hypothetical protein